MNVVFKPLVTVYIPTKNRKNLLLRAFKSVINQSYNNIEIVVVDDGSNDGTTFLLKELAFQYSNLTVIYLTESIGAPAARNKAIKVANGELVTGLDDDDYFLPDRIKHLVEYYDERYAFVCTGCYWNYGRVKRKLNGSKKIITLEDQLFLNQASNQVLVSKKRLIDIGGYDLNFVSCQDWELWTRMILKYGDALRIKNVDYIIDVSHGSHRITDNPVRVKGFHQFKKKYVNLMSGSHKKAMHFHLIVALGKSIDLQGLCKILTKPLWLINVKYWLSCKFPRFARKRLDKMK